MAHICRPCFSNVGVPVFTRCIPAEKTYSVVESDVDGPTVLLARTSHQLSAAVGGAQAHSANGGAGPYSAAFSHLGVLKVLLSAPPRPSGRKNHWAQHLTDLATKPGEKCGLATGQLILRGSS